MRTVIKILKWLGGIFLAILCLDIFLVASFAVFSSQVQKANAIIVLGAAINSPALYNRSLEALRLYEEGDASVIVLSGGRISDEDVSEATYMQRAIQSRAAKPVNLILEEDSHSTFENIRNSKARLPNVKAVIIVTDKFHLARSVMTAKALGFKDVYWSAPGTRYPAAELRYHYLREVAAMLAYLPKFVFR